MATNDSEGVIFYKEPYGYNKTSIPDRPVLYNGKPVFLKDVPDGELFSFGHKDHTYTKLGAGKTFTVLCVAVNCASEEDAKAAVMEGKKCAGHYTTFSIVAVKEYHGKAEAKEEA